MSADTMRFLGGRVDLTLYFGNEGIDMLEAYWDFLRGYVVASDETNLNPARPEWFLPEYWEVLKEECREELRGGVLPELVRRPELDTPTVAVFTCAENTDPSTGEAAMRLLECGVMLVYWVLSEHRNTCSSHVSYTMFDKTQCYGHTHSETISEYSNVFDHDYNI